MTLDDDWKNQALCEGKDPDSTIFFPPKNGTDANANIKKAKSICHDCPVQLTCRDYAIAHKIPYGVWGGMTKDERHAMPKSIRRDIRRKWFRDHPDSHAMPQTMTGAARMNHTSGKLPEGIVRAPGTTI